MMHRERCLGVSRSIEGTSESRPRDILHIRPTSQRDKTPSASPTPTRTLKATVADLQRLRDQEMSHGEKDGKFLDPRLSLPPLRSQSRVLWIGQQSLHTTAR